MIDQETIAVLLIEENPVEAGLIEAALTEDVTSPYRVEWVTTLDDSLFLLRDRKQAVVLIDIAFVGENPETVMNRIAHTAPGSLVVVLCEPKDEYAAIQAVRSGAYDYLFKHHIDAYWLPLLLRYVIRARTMQATLFEQQERAQVTLNCIEDGVICTDTAGKVNYLNPVAQHMTGWSREAAIGRVLEEVFNVVDTPSPVHGNTAVSNITKSSILIRADGVEIPIEDSTSLIHDQEGKLIGTVTVLRDVSEAHATAAKMAHLAQHDFLTDLPNRLLLNDRLTHAISLAHRQSKQLALLFLDLDHFKHVNDSLGHAIGDQLLQQVSIRLKACIRSSDTLCRQGGDEFVVLLSEIDEPQDAARVAAKMLDSFTMPVLVDSHEIYVSISIGISMYPHDGQDVDTIIKNADIAMYHAKESGRNNFQFFTAELNIRAIQRHSLKNSLRRALDRHEFKLYYQPKIDLENGRLIGMEALLRWERGKHGNVMPQQFIPIAEESGLITSIGQWVLREACSQARAWQERGLPRVPVAVNISAAEFRNKDFINNLSLVLEETGLSPEYLELELTEGILLQDADAIASIFKTLKDLGIRLSIDDFGTGYSNLSYLRHFPIDTLKIDQSFIRDISVDADDATLVRAMVNIAKSLKLKAVAEGVETPEHLAFLQALQCDEAQGFYFGEPQPSAAFERIMINGLPKIEPPILHS